MSNELLQQILTEIKSINNRLDKLEEGQEAIKNKLDEFEVQNANKHIEILGKVDHLITDVKFIKHKEYQNEQELFTIKDHLKIIK